MLYWKNQRLNQNIKVWVGYDFAAFCVITKQQGSTKTHTNANAPWFWIKQYSDYAIQQG